MKSRELLAKQNDTLLDELREWIHYCCQLGIEWMDAESPLRVLEDEILRCARCRLAESRHKAVPGEGNSRTEMMFVGEAPGRDEDIQGKPFVGRAGQLLTKIINAMKFQREEVYITNIVKCRPPNNRNPQKDEISSCQGFLWRQIEIIRPRVIVTLGKVASDFFISSNLSMTALRGNFFDVGEIKIMPTFHPAYLVRNEGNRIIRKMVWEDMQKVMAFLDKK